MPTTPARPLAATAGGLLLVAAMAAGSPGETRSIRFDDPDTPGIQDNRRHLAVEDLGAGTDTLRVRGSNGHGGWNEGGVAPRPVIAPPLWRTSWFRALAVLGGGALFFVVNGFRSQSIRRRGADLERLIAERTGELAAAQEQLVRKERLAVLGELAGTVAHELRNPLGVLRNSAYFLKLSAAGGEKTARHLEMMEREIERCSSIITELLDYGRDPKPKRRHFALQEAVEKALARVWVPPEIRVDRDLPPVPLTVDADPAQIERALINLIRNAVQAMTEGGDLGVSCRLDGQEAVVRMTDTGAGIGAEAMAKIFEPLFSGKARGIGLGLPISRRYANLNGGRIECESEEGEGATFRLVLPTVAGDGTSARGRGTAISRRAASRSRLPPRPPRGTGRWTSSSRSGRHRE